MLVHNIDHLVCIGAVSCAAADDPDDDCLLLERSSEGRGGSMALPGDGTLSRTHYFGASAGTVAIPIDQRVPSARCGRSMSEWL